MRRPLVAALAFLAATSALAQPAPPVTTAVVADPAAPLGKLPDAALPLAYRLRLTILPDRPRFSGHAEIDVQLKAATTRLYMHGRELRVTSATARGGGRSVAARWTQVDPTGVVRLDFAAPLPAGPVTLAFDYDAAFGENPSGLYHVAVGGAWYSWTQFESIDARAAFPSFDEPGFKTPFAIEVLTAPGNTVVSNAAPAGVSLVRADPAAQRLGGAPAPATLELHRFQPTKPLPTYLVALVTGPLAVVRGAVPPGPHRAAPLPLGIVATRPQAANLAYALAETPRILGLLEDYFGQPFPFPKLDQIASPVMGGAMENAGADIYDDSILLLDPAAPTGRKQRFGMVVAHELSHQWFGDLVTPAWWDDIWLNESFANWMGFRIGNAWRPELNIGTGAIAEGLAAMNLDALEVGRPIHQPIVRNDQIDNAFDQITYGKGGQVVAMIAAYLGDAKFRDGVRLHLSRHMYGNATSEQFFEALADAAKDPRVVSAMRSFVDQQGVPLVTFRRDGGRLVATQSRYAFLGSKPAPATWTIPLCIRQGGERTCTLLDRPSMTIDAAAGAGPLVPNAGGTGYYRFDLPAAEWTALIAASPTLPAGEALATVDSLWAAFRAGTVGFAPLLAATRAMAASGDSDVALSGGQRLQGLHVRGLIDAAALPAYRRLIDAIYAPRLAQIGFDPTAGAHLADNADRQQLRQEMVELLAGEARDPAIRARLLVAGKAYMGGDAKALDPAFLAPGLAATVADGGLPAAKLLIGRALASEDPAFRGAALTGAASTGDAAIAAWLLGLDDPRLRKVERLQLLRVLMTTPETRDLATDWLLKAYPSLAASAGIFVTSRLPQMLSVQCSAEQADGIERRLGPTVTAMGAGLLEYRRALETIRHCAALKAARSAEIARALEAAAG